MGDILVEIGMGSKNITVASVKMLVSCLDAGHLANMECVTASRLDPATTPRV